jgi:hypothetical protein
MNEIAPSLLARRFELPRTQYLCERFEKSPNINEECSVADHLRICYSNCDASIIPSIRDVFLKMYAYVKEWFNYRGDIAIELWMAPEAVDLQYMTCLPCDDGFACAPGSRDGRNVILLASPLSGGKNADENRLAAVLAHEIAHNFITAISHATVFTMKRKEQLDVPMWLEEGLCQLIQCEVNPACHAAFDKGIACTTEWYALDEIWNDLSACEDVNRAYLQAYKDARMLVEQRGKAELVRSLYLNRAYDLNWTDFLREGAVVVADRKSYPQVA